MVFTVVIVAPTRRVRFCAWTGKGLRYFCRSRPSSSAGRVPRPRDSAGSGMRNSSDSSPPSPAPCDNKAGGLEDTRQPRGKCLGGGSLAHTLRSSSKRRRKNFPWARVWFGVLKGSWEGTWEHHGKTALQKQAWHPPERPQAAPRALGSPPAFARLAGSVCSASASPHRPAAQAGSGIPWLVLPPPPQAQPRSGPTSGCRNQALCLFCRKQRAGLFFQSRQQQPCTFLRHLPREALESRRISRPDPILERGKLRHRQTTWLA